MMFCHFTLESNLKKHLQDFPFFKNRDSIRVYGICWTYKWKVNIYQQSLTCHRSNRWVPQMLALLAGCREPGIITDW